MSNLTAFNTQLINFFNELIELYPGDNDLRFGKNSCELLKKTNPRKTLDMFKENILPYEDNIMKRDENFFKNDLDYSKALDNDSKSLLIVQNLKKYWDQLDDKNKGNIWLYFQVLTKISKKC